ncbi:MAG: HNH endonuclease [Myxococcaceae bacterium]
MTTLAAAARWNERLASLWAEERKACAAFLAALLEFDDKQAWRPLGYSGLFRYLAGSLGMSDSVAYRRLQAVRLARWCPEVLRALGDGRLCLSTLGEVEKVLRPNNWKEVLPRFFGTSKKEAEVLAAGLLPAAVLPKRDVIVPLPALPPEGVDDAAKVQVGENQTEPAQRRAGELSTTSFRVVSTGEAEKPAHVTEVANAQRQPMHRIHFTASETFVRKLQKAKDAVAHRVDASRLEAVLEQALEALLEKEAKRPKAGISQAAKREVQGRDEGQCQWPLLQGGVCGEKRFLQLDHVIPKAQGGDGAADNLRLLCAQHNREAAQRVFGEGWVSAEWCRTDVPR